MVQALSPQLREHLELQVLSRTGRRVRDLAVELHPERIVLRGSAQSYYVKQLAQHGVHDMLPHVRLENAIVVWRINVVRSLRERMPVSRSETAKISPHIHTSPSS
jgi:hypothetical protein